MFGSFFNYEKKWNEHRITIFKLGDDITFIILMCQCIILDVINVDKLKYFICHRIVKMTIYIKGFYNLSPWRFIACVSYKGDK